MRILKNISKIYSLERSRLHNWQQPVKQGGVKDFGDFIIGKRKFRDSLVAKSSPNLNEQSIVII